MSGVTLKVVMQDIKRIEADVVVVGFYADVRPLKGGAGQIDWLLCGALSALLIENRLRGTAGEMALLTARGKIPTPKVFMLGLGPRSEFALPSLRAAARAAAAGALDVGATRMAMEYLPPPEVSAVDVLSALREGFSEGADGRRLDVSLLIPDRPSYEELSRLVQP